MTTQTPPEFSRLVSVERVDRRGLERKIEADPAERAALAKRFDLIQIDRLVATVRLKSINGGTAIRLDGHIEGSVVQSCTVTLEPVPATVESDFVLLFTRQKDGEEVDIAFEDEIVEPLEGSDIDIGEAAAQELAVALDPYPRAPGVSLESLDAEVLRLQEADELEENSNSAPDRARGIHGRRED
ncbi:uncharacterized protein DUF177 involved in 23S rRNA accumulation [Stella humosa]|uniref:Uncharacterized protein DUF177 involved in 23S rRNA accumulation n=1 Tax=Stella humosa TaxID=94 RepID=A0A3N1MBH2_9PROT|nr:DUF177 domain-containing protein [Stella humosa]ROQ01083.1 uncharacterized protein DUF177 involved in 23S rRNA accumulation [Stella humosa]BBK31455.1 phosphodiesterase [Stella humosa]